MILVTGGAGYIGSHTVRKLIENGYSPLIVDNLSTGHKESIPEQAKFIQCDIRDKKELDKLFSENKIELVIHFAASIEAGESMKEPLKFYDNNVYGTEIILSTMQEHSVDKIIFSSSAAVYSDDGNKILTEDSPLNPSNAYGETKLAMEKMMKWCNLAYGMKYVALRYFNVAGAGYDGAIGEDHSPETHLIPLILQVALGKRKEISVFGDDYDTPDGTCVRDFIHVEDLADAHILAAKYLLRGNESDVFNLGNGDGFSVLDVIETSRKVTGHKVPAIIKERRKGDPAILVASSAKAKKILNWQPNHPSIEAIISSAWHWHKSHPNGYAPKNLN